MAQIVEGLTKYLAILPLPEDYPSEGKPSRTPQPPLSSEIYSILSASCLFPLIESYLRNDSLLVMIRQFDLYVKLLELIRVIAGHDELVVFLDSTPGKSDSVSELVQRASNFASKSIPNTTKITKLKSSQPAKKKLTKTHIQEVEEEEIALARDLFITRDIVSSSLEQVKAKKLKDSEQSHKKEMPTPADDTTEFAVKYKEALADEQFGEYNMLDSSGSSYKHHYNEKIQSDSGTNPAKMKRLRQEIQTLYSSLPLYPNSSIFLRFDESRMDILQCVITGPVDTPYENGCFLFDIYCPSDYPSSSPLMNLETTGNGSVRFNPNLYNCGKVCLSLLGTWRGGPNEKWNEKTSTLLQVFVSIQSLIFVEKPYFNEPGYENSMNTPEGDSQNRKYNEVIRVATLQWAIIDQISNPSKGFEKAITTHFLLKRNDIMRQCYAWIKDARKDNSKAHLTTLQKLTEEVKVLLQSLDPSTPLIIPQDEEEKIQKKVNSELEKQRWLMALSVLDLVPGYPIGLCVKALEINKDVLDNSVNWLLEQGESYIFDHPEVFSLVNPLEDPKD
uniref:UBC core domain-containing protein n=1 Tax=Arcella intermedia TaxID=1963864 RepID=A0A6B2L0B4_9EUKA